MSDFYSLLEEKIAAIREDPNQSRQVVYDLARYALKNKIYGRDPTLTAAQVNQQMIALEAAIAVIEAKSADRIVTLPRKDVKKEEKKEPKKEAKYVEPKIESVSFAMPNEGDSEPTRGSAEPTPNFSEPAREDDRPLERKNTRREIVVLPPRNLRRNERFPEEPFDDRYQANQGRDLRITPEAVALIQLLVNERNSRSRRVLSWMDGLLRVGVVAAILLGAYAVWSGKIHEYISPAAPPPVEIAKETPPPPPQQQAAEPDEPMLLPGVPMPSGYGVYAIHQDRLFGLSPATAKPVDPRARHLLQITDPSRSVFVDGRVSFAIYRRELANAAPVSIPIRIAAKIASMLRTGPGGTLSAVRPEVDTWLIYSAGYMFRTHPVPGKPEMVLVRPDDPDLVLPPGRYVLLMNDEPYEFSIAGEITDPRSCVEGFPTPHGPVFHVCKSEKKTSG